MRHGFALPEERPKPSADQLAGVTEARNMSKTLQVQLSDAAIKKHAADLDVAELKDPRHPLRFRYRHDRSRGSWHVVTYDSGAHWKKAGNWPDVSARLMLESLPKVLQRLMEERAAGATVDGWQLVGQVLEWYAGRVEADRVLSPERRSTIGSAIRLHLRPALGLVRLADLNKATLDDALYMPLQSAEYSAAHIKSVLSILKRAFRLALRQGRIAVDPLASVTYGDFNKAKISPKAARLRHIAVSDLLASWAAAFDQVAPDITFAALMLCHGTRISETRKAKWQSMDLVAGEWVIYAGDNKSKREHVLPLTVQAVALLTRYREWQRARGYAGAYLFPAPTRSGKPISRSQSFDIFTRLGAREWTSHDLRKLAATLWMEQGTDSDIVTMLLNHARGNLRSTYVQTHAPALKRAALARWHDWLDTQGFLLLHDSTAARRAGQPSEAEAADWLVCQPN